LKRRIFFLTECADFCAYQDALSYAIASMVRQSNAKRPEKMPTQRLYLSRAQVI